MTDVTTQQGMNPALKIILLVVAGLIALMCIGGLVAAWLFSAGVDRLEGARDAAMTRSTLEQTAEVVTSLYERDGDLIESLAELGWDDADPIVDAWGNAVVYERAGDSSGFVLTSYGADGAEGGEDENADIELRRTLDPR